MAWKSQFAGPPPYLKEGRSKHQPGSIVIAWLELGSMYSFWKSIVLVLMILGWGGGSGCPCGFSENDCIGHVPCLLIKKELPREAPFVRAELHLYFGCLCHHEGMRRPDVPSGGEQQGASFCEVPHLESLTKCPLPSRSSSLSPSLTCCQSRDDGPYPDDGGQEAK